MNETAVPTIYEINEYLGSNSIQIKKWDEILTADMIRFPLSDLSTLGTAFSGLAASFALIGKAAQQSGVLYQAVLPKGAHLAMAKDGKGLLGAAVKKGKGIVGQARFVEAGKAAETAQSAGNFFMAMSLMAISMSLKDIAENQKNIIDFLEADKEAILKGNLITLSEIIQEYQLNWENAQFRYNRENQVLDIRCSAEQNIQFYRDRVGKKTGKKQILHFDTEKTLNEEVRNWKHYQLALYLYAFATFLDVMLLQNFEKVYLNSVAQSIRSHASEYSELFEKTMAEIKEYAETSVQSRALEGLTNVGRAVGNTIAGKQEKKNRFSEFLISNSDKTEAVRLKSIAQTTESFEIVKDSGITMFIDKIALINAMYNDPVRIAIDKENLYLAVPEN